MAVVEGAAGSTLARHMMYAIEAFRSMFISQVLIIPSTLISVSILRHLKDFNNAYYFRRNNNPNTIVTTA